MITNEDILHLLTGRTPLNLNKLLSDKIKSAGISLTKEQWSVMAVLWKEDGCTQQTLADQTYRGRAGITRLLDTLERKGFVERKDDPEDRRNKLIFLTELGKSIEGTVVSVLSDIITSLTTGISKDQLDSFRNTFEKINININKIENE